MTLQEMATKWLESKEQERIATERRRLLEDEMTKLLALPEDLDGSKTIKEGELVIKVTGRLTRKIDDDLLQELAAEHGLGEKLSTVCRWKPELNLTVWKNTDESVVKALSPAITVTPGRPSYNITTK